MIVRRGDIRFAEMPNGDGSMQKGKRPVIIVQNEMGNMYSPNVTVVPLTSKMDKKQLPVHVFIRATELNGLSSNSIASVEGIITISKTMLGNHLGRISDIEIKQIDRAIEVQLQINKDKEERGITRKEDFYSFDEKKARNHAQSILELEKLLSDSEIQKNKQFVRGMLTSIKLQYEEFKSYCTLHHRDVNKYYKPKYNISNFESDFGISVV